MSEAESQDNHRPSAQDGGTLHRVAGVVDEGIYRFEKSLVTLASLIMTGTVAFDIVFRSFQSSESLLARKRTHLQLQYDSTQYQYLEQHLSLSLSIFHLCLCLYSHRRGQ